MNLSLKKILKQSDVLFISEVDDSYKKIKSILDIFFRKTLLTNSLINANQIYEKEFPKIIIIDINLHEANGISFIKELRRKNKNLQIIIITLNKEIDILLEAIKLNLVDYLLKPLDINKLINALNICAKQILNSGEIVTIINQNIKYDYVKKVIINGKTKIDLTKNERRLLELFLENKNDYIKNEDIKKRIWSEKEISDSAFKSLINRLSIKIGKETIRNSFGNGYGIFD
jgi:DNA-binding response OmpR family regulator